MNHIKIPKDPRAYKLTEVIPGLWVAEDFYKYDEYYDYFEVAPMFKRNNEDVSLPLHTTDESNGSMP